MSKYREKPKEPKEVEAIYWTGENLNEIKEFLGDCFVKVDEQGVLTFKRYSQKHYGNFDFKRRVPLNWGFITKNKNGIYSAVAAKRFLQDWEEIEGNIIN